jgi:hypothetical protein
MLRQREIYFWQFLSGTGVLVLLSLVLMSGHYRRSAREIYKTQRKVLDRMMPLADQLSAEISALKGGDRDEPRQKQELQAAKRKLADLIPPFKELIRENTRADRFSELSTRLAIAYTIVALMNFMISIKLIRLSRGWQAVPLDDDDEGLAHPKSTFEVRASEQRHLP